MTMASNVMYLNPRRRRRRRNPDEYAMMENPGFTSLLMDQVQNGSDITQNISVIDLVAGSGSLAVNHAVAKMIGLTGWSGIIAAGIIPFITGAVAGMAHSRIGSSVFFGGQMDFMLKLLGKVPALGTGLVEQADGSWVLSTFTTNPLKLVGLAPAQRTYELPASSMRSQAPVNSPKQVKVM